MKIISYNMGYGVRDYHQQVLTTDTQRAKGVQTQIKADRPTWDYEVTDRGFQREYQSALKKTRDALITYKPDAYLLQEVGEMGRSAKPLIHSIKNDYHFSYLKNGQVDTLVALAKSRFTNVRNHSQSLNIGEGKSKPVAIATATDLKTKKVVAFVSVHVPGFNFKAEVDTQGVVKPECAQMGNRYCQEIAKKLNTLGVTEIQIIGGDMNSTPENAPERFATFTQKGFKLNRTHQATNVNHRDGKALERRELDYIFIKETHKKSWPEKTFPKLWKLADLFWKKLQPYLFSYPTTKALLAFDQSNASDHRPVLHGMVHKKGVRQLAIDGFQGIWKQVAP